MHSFNRRGQLMVETALVLPVLAFVVWTLAQLAFFCMNVVEHQRMAQVAAENLTLNSLTRKPYHWFYRSRGNTFPAVLRQRLIATPEQRDPHALGVIETGGHLFGVQVKSELISGAFMGRILQRANQIASAEAWLEPIAPEGD